MTVRAVLAAAIALGLGGCEQVRESVSAGIVNGVTGTIMGPKKVEPANFVTASRPEKLESMAIGVTPPVRAVPHKSAAEVAAAEAAMRAQSQQNIAVGEQTANDGKKLLENLPKPPKAE